LTLVRTVTGKQINTSIANTQHDLKRLKFAKRLLHSRNFGKSHYSSLPMPHASDRRQSRSQLRLHVLPSGRTSMLKCDVCLLIALHGRQLRAAFSDNRNHLTPAVACSRDPRCQASWHLHPPYFYCYLVWTLVHAVDPFCLRRPAAISCALFDHCSSTISEINAIGCLFQTNLCRLFKPQFPQSALSPRSLDEYHPASICI